MRELVRSVIENAHRSGDRIGVEPPGRASACLAAETIRLARMATSIHLVSFAKLAADRAHARPQDARSMRESVS